jgi:CRISPR-associated protein Cas1
MKHLLNTLFVTLQGAYLAREGMSVIVRHEKQTKLRVPVHTLGAICCFGRVGVSPPLMGFCAKQNVAIVYFDEHNRFLARIYGPVSGNVLLRKKQYSCSDELASCCEMAKAVILSKIANGRSVLLRAMRDRPDGPNNSDLESAAGRMNGCLEFMKSAQSLESIRAVEGEAAKAYFDVFDHLITSQKEDFYFRGRSRRPPMDNMNALLSFLYTLLASDVASALEGVGLDPAVGLLHRDRPGRMSLALDLMEELRPYLADRLALSLVNRQQIHGKGFTTTASGAVRMNDETRKELLIAYQKRKQEEIVHPFLNEKIAVGLIPHVQALLLARHLRGDIDGYPPFFWK